jgi:RsiW-degrading membrane proteinase PrsW (M82 family)
VGAFTGLARIEGFSVRQLLAKAFKRHSAREMESYLMSAGQNPVAQLDDVSTAWPQPWAFGRVLAFGLLVLVGFLFGLCVFENPKLLPGLIVVGAFCVPLSCAVLFFEYNVLHNMSVYQILKFTLAGGILSIVASLILFKVTQLAAFLGEMSAGIVEEVAKLLVVVVMLRGCKDYRWILNAMVAGSAVGAGFAGFETVGYTFELMEQHDPLFSRLLQRAVCAPFGHVVWTAVTAGALWRVKQDKPFNAGMLFDGRFLRVFVIVVLLHMFWNSGLLQLDIPRHTDFRFWLRVWFLGSAIVISLACTWGLALLLIQEGLRQVQSAKDTSGAEPASQPTV